MENRNVLNYTLLRMLGRGGMAEVWYAENRIEKPAAVKILNVDLSHNAQIVDRFRNEAKITVKLSHPNIRQVYNYDEIDGRPCMIMEYLEGGDLKSMIKSGRRFTEEELHRWWNQLVSALNYTHAQGIVHRDIKPANIFIDKAGNVKLLDFGIAKIKEGISMTQTGSIMGTLMYMSPEQVDDSKHIGPASDIYSLAVTFVHLLSGKAPYDSSTSSDYAIRKGIVEIPLNLDGVPSDWQVFLRPYLAKNPAERPALAEFGLVHTASSTTPISDETVVDTSAPAKNTDDKGTIVAGTPSAHTLTQPQSQPQSQPRRVWPWVLAICLVVVVVCGALMGGRENHRDDIVTTDYVEVGLPAAEENNTVPTTENKPVPENKPAVVQQAAPESKPLQENKTEVVQPVVEASKPVPEGFVDLGLSVYWKSTNETGGNQGLYTYDEAVQKFGSKLPNITQYEELVDRCTWTWTGSGCQVTGPNGKSIILPAAGYRRCNGDMINIGACGYYWSSTSRDSDYSRQLYFHSDYHCVHFDDRCYGMSVRLVHSK